MNKPETGTAIIDPKDVRKTFSVVLKNWYWFILFLGLGVAGGIFYLKKSTSIFGAEAKIIFKGHEKSFMDAMTETLAPGKPTRDEIANEIEIIKSSSLIGSVIENLNLDISYFIEGRLKTGEIYKGIPYKVEGKLLDKSFYNIPFRLTILNKTNYRLSVEMGGYKYDKTHRFGELVINERFSMIITGDTNIIGYYSGNIAETKHLFQFNDKHLLVGKYQHALQVSQDEDASVITLFIEDPVSDKAVNFLKTLAESYVTNSVSVQKQINENTLKFIEAQIEQVENILNGVESNLEQFQRQKTTMNPENEQGVLLQQKMDFETQRARLTTQLKTVDYIYEQLTSGNELSSSAPSVLGESDDPALNEAFRNLSALQQKRTNLLFSNTPSSPVVKEVDAQLSIARQTLISSVMNVRRSLVVQINSLSSQLGEYQGAMSQMPTTMRGLVNINRKVEINEKMYLYLLEYRAKTVIEKASIVADKAILEPASETGLVRPIKEKLILSGAGLGIVLTLMLIFLKSVFYNYIHTKEDLTELSTLPIIGVIGKSKDAKNDYLVVDKHPQSLTSESFRVIRTNISYFNAKAGNKVILFTSTMAGEGKTFSAINTATILAKTKKKVVVVDLDLHKPKQANAFNIKNDTGVTSYLVGKATLSEIVKETPIENLQVILSGPHTPNASELIADPMMEVFIQDLKNNYDYVLLDTPPAGILSDAVALMKFSDLNIYILKAGFSKKDFVDVAHHIVEKNDVKHLTFLLNGVNLKHIPSGYGGGYYK